MDFNDVLLSIVAAAATLTPLILGLLKYYGDKKKEAAPVEATAATAPAPVLGETIDFESVAVASLTAQISLLTESHNDLRDRLRNSDAEIRRLEAGAARADADRRNAEAERDAVYARLRQAGMHP